MMLNFNPLLAANFDPAKVVFPIWATPKVDGVRAMIQDLGPVTRTRKPIPNAHVRTQLTSLPLGLDGELEVAGGFNTTQSAVMSRSGQPIFTYNVFDIYAEGGYNERYKTLNALQWDFPDYVRLVPRMLIFTLQELRSYHEYWVDRGYEGLVLRAPEGRYKQGRATPKENIFTRYVTKDRGEAIMLSAKQEMENTNEAYKTETGAQKRSSHQDGLIPKDSMGTLWAKFKGVQFGVGTGFTAIQRKEIWDNREDYAGRMFTFEYRGYGPNGAPRFPSFIGWRLD